MRAGDLRHRVIIEAPTETQNPSGAFKTEFAAVETVWAAVWPRKADEREEGGRQVSRTTHEVRMRYTPNLTSKCRLNFNGRILSPFSIANVDERNVELQIMASEAT